MLFMLLLITADHQLTIIGKLSKQNTKSCKWASLQLLRPTTAVDLPNMCSTGTMKKDYLTAKTRKHSVECILLPCHTEIGQCHEKQGILA